MELTINSCAKLNNGVEMPYLGLGVFQIREGSPTRNAVRYALEAGYRHVDTAKLYGNETSVGETVRESGISPDEVFVTTKLWNSDHGYAQAKAAFTQSFHRLELERIDLYLIHWPGADRLRGETWRALEEMLDSGRTRAIGVSNYSVRHLEDLLSKARVVPAVNQIELHPYNYKEQKATIDLCQEHGIQIEAYSPLTRGRKLTESRLKEIARRHGKSTAQVLIRWSLQHGFVVIPKSSHQERIQENANVFDFELTDDEMAQMNGF